MILCSPCAAEGMNSNPLWEAKGSGNFGSGYGSRLILEVTCHWKIVVFSNLKYFLKVKSWKFMELFKYSNLKVIGVHPVDRSLPVTSRFDNHPKRWNTVFQEGVRCLLLISRSSPYSLANVAAWLILGDLLRCLFHLGARVSLSSAHFGELESGHSALASRLLKAQGLLCASLGRTQFLAQGCNIYCRLPGYSTQQLYHKMIKHL